MNYNNLIRVCVDGIYYIGEEKINKVFQMKTKKTFENIAGDSYISNLVEFEKTWDLPEFKDNYAKELYIGAGGNGKTHLNLTDKGLIKPLYIAPSWKLSTKKRNEYGVNADVLYNLISKDPAIFNKIKRRFNTLIFDEVSMYQEHEKELIFKRYKSCKIIFCGDIGYQCEPFNKDGSQIKEITTSGFDKITELKINYRFECDELKYKVSILRKMIKEKTPENVFNNYVKNSFNRISLDELKQNYKINDMILCRKHESKDAYTENFKYLNKWYITTNTKDYKNGDILICDEKPKTTAEIRHAFTIHSIQGETAPDKLYIDYSTNYAPRVLYTAISRAKKYNQIYFIC
jgi:hypothetical protein